MHPMLFRQLSHSTHLVMLLAALKRSHHDADSDGYELTEADVMFKT